MMQPRQMLQHLCQLAEKLGCEVRMEMLDGSGGLCEIRGTKFLFVDTSLDLELRVEQIAEALCDQPGVGDIYVLPEVREFLRRTQDRSRS